MKNFIIIFSSSIFLFINYRIKLINLINNLFFFFFPFSVSFWQKKKLNSGKYAAVKRCRERASGRQWAAKFLKKRRRAQELRAEALHEVAVLDAAARCSRLVSLHQVFETKTEMVLVLEL